MYTEIENGMVSGQGCYNARIDEPLTLDDLAWTYRIEKAPGGTDAVDKIQG